MGKFLLTIVLLCSISSAYAEPVCKVIDGDTFTFCDGLTVRLSGVDTPEKGEPYYQVARRTLAELIQTHDLSVSDCHQDTTGKRQACNVHADGKDV